MIKDCVSENANTGNDTKVPLYAWKNLTRVDRQFPKYKSWNGRFVDNQTCLVTGAKIFDIVHR